jgi:protein CpxP
MKQTVLMALVLSTIVLAMGISWAGPGYGRGGDGVPCDGPRWGNEHQPRHGLDLSDEQRAEIKSLREVEREKLEPLREQLHQNREAMRQELEKDSVDENKLRELARAHADMKVEMKLAKRQFRTEMDTILSPEQIAQRDERRESRSAIRGQRGGHGGKGRHKGDCGNCTGPVAE